MSTFKRWLVLVIVSSALLLIVMDMTILYTALPSLTHDLGASASEKLWILNGYSLVMAGLLPAMGTLGDRLGHKKIFSLGLLVFTAASLLAAFSPDPYVLVVGRVLLAVGASMMMPATLSIIRITFTNGRELGLAIGIWGSVASGGAGLGPIVGGLLLEHFWWGSVFLINLPIAIIALVLTLIYVPNHPGHKEKKWDLISSIQIMIAMVAIIYSIKEFARREGSLTFAIAGAVIGIAALIIFIHRQNRSENPLIDLSLFKINGFSAGFITALVGTFAQLGVQYIVTQRLQLVGGLSPLQAGLYTISVPLAALIAGLLTGSILHRYDVIRIKSAALLLAALGMGVYLLQFNSGIAGQILGLALLGAGLGAGMTAASHSIMSYAPPEKAGMAASIEEVAYEMGGASGIAIIGSMSGLVYTLAMKIPAGLQVPGNVEDSLDEALLVAEGLPAQAAEALKEAGRAAFNQSFSAIIAGVALFLVAASVIVGLTGARSKKKSSAQS
ncbi:MFS transporter, DHA2 family, multidrug resistance protein [Paenibacillus algorifonticola]|uniref:MFS transporter, DHA2 family, multidrug resistance protein n=1 Tax=Paenibacillus algorifonticola TaxID=684063 RepID=A0A1I2BB54_9BACL|nr:MFS transporter [Paenibacillus algorifonticola]SFE53404.1 MFS transporter, DHA2 family, multidrug resistance protein [Paenibacillus algorifonticola]